MIGKTIGQYQVIDKIGEGGMGAVYKAEDTTLHRLVALKTLSSHLTEDAEARERFIREAQSASSLNHPNITTVHEFIEDDDTRLICMEYVEGKTIRDMVESGVVSVRKAIDIIMQAAEALDAAHNRGILHRDVKSAFIGKPVAGIEGEVEFACAAGYDFVQTAIGLQRFFGLGKHSYQGQEASFATEKPIFQTKASRYSVFSEGDEERLWAEEGSGNIATLEDFDNFVWPDINEFDFSLLDEAGAMIPEGMKVLNTIQGVFTPVWLLMGGENFYISLIENPELVSKISQRICSLQLEIVRKVLSFECLGALRVNDDLAYKNGLLVSPKYLREYFFPWLKEVGELCRKRDIPLL